MVWPVGIFASRVTILRDGGFWLRFVFGNRKWEFVLLSMFYVSIGKMPTVLYSTLSQAARSRSRNSSGEKPRTIDTRRWVPTSL